MHKNHEFVTLFGHVLLGHFEKRCPLSTTLLTEPRHVQDFTNKGYIVAICPPTQLYTTVDKTSAYSPFLKIAFFKFFS